MGARSGATAILRSFNEGESIRSVRLLGVGELPFIHQFGVLTIPLPEKLPTKYIPVLTIELF